MKRCSVDNCNRDHYARSYCELHYNRWRAHGDPLIKLRKRKTKEPKICSIDNCNREMRSNGYCNKHYQRYRKHGSPNVALKKNKPSDICLICGEKAYLAGLCTKHYREYRIEKQVCKILYHHSKDMQCDPEALTDEFMSEMVGISCDKLKEIEE